MKEDLFINGKDAYTEWGISMTDGFVEKILIPPPMKSLIENESRLEHGKRVLSDNHRVSSRDVTLIFHIFGKTDAEYMRNYKAFLNLLQSGMVTIKIPRVGNEVYKLFYLKASSFTQNFKRTSSKLSVKFEEPNPMDRS